MIDERLVTMCKSIRFSLLILVGFGLSACAPLTPPVPAANAPLSATAAPERETPGLPLTTPLPTSVEPVPGDTRSATLAAPAASPVPRTVVPTLLASPAPTATSWVLLERVPPTAMPDSNEVPQAVLQAIQAAARAQLGLPTDATVTILRADALIWPDGALGCPQPGLAYTQAEVEGYWIQVEAAGQVLDYRVPLAGLPLLCMR